MASETGLTCTKVLEGEDEVVGPPITLVLEPTPPMLLHRRANQVDEHSTGLVGHPGRERVVVVGDRRRNAHDRRWTETA